MGHEKRGWAVGFWCIVKSKFWYPHVPQVSSVVKFCVSFPKIPSLPLVSELPSSLWGVAPPYFLNPCGPGRRYPYFQPSKGAHT